MEILNDTADLLYSVNVWRNIGE